MIKYLVILALLVNGAYAEAAGGRPKSHPESITTQTSTLIAYHIQYGVQRDDSNYINSNNLNYVGKMASCPQVSIKENPYTYRATAKIDREDMTVKVEVNRSNCQIDKAAVKTYLDDAIKINQRKWLEQSEREQQTRAVDPRGPYKLGCEAYQQHIKGLSDVTSIDCTVLVIT